jgi:type II secretory pathway pseudopilin PulG
MLVVGILVILLVIIGAAWRSLTQTGVEAKAINLISSFASVARTYAMRHQLETVLTIDPNTGQVEIWVWDTVGNTNVPPADPSFALPNSRYVPVPILDTTARLPRKGGAQNENHAVRIAPIDWDNDPLNLTDDLRFEALARFAISFDPQGRQVMRDLVLKYEPGNFGKIPNPPSGGQVISIWPGSIYDYQDAANWNVWPRVPLLASDTNRNRDWFNISTSRAGWAYEPPDGSQLPNGPADPRLPATVGNAIIQNRAKAFMLNQYTGRVILGGRP